MEKDIKKYVPWIILLVLILALGTWYFLAKRITEEERLSYDGIISEAQAHVEARQYSMGMQKYYEAAEIVPTGIEAYEGIISILIIKNRLEEAEDVVEQSARGVSNYDRSVLYKLVGDEYYEKEEYSKAYDMYDAGSFLGVDNMGLELMLGKTYLNLEKVSDARDRFSKSGYEGEHLEEANLLLSYIYAIDDTSKANSTLRSIPAVEHLGVHYEKFGEVLDGLTEDKKFNATKLAREYINAGYPYLAILILEPKKDEMTEYLEGMYFLGRAYFDHGKYNEAIEVLDKALALGGMEQEILWTKARSYFLTNNLEDSISSYDSAIGYTEEVIPSRLVEEYVKLLLDNDQRLKAADLIRGLSTLEIEKTCFNLLAVEVNYELEEDGKVEFYLNRLAEQQLNNIEENEYLQWRLRTFLDEVDEDEDEEEEIDKEQIERHLDRLFELDRFNPYYYFFLAKLQIKEGEEDLATQSLEQAIEYDLEYTVTEEALTLLSSLR